MVPRNSKHAKTHRRSLTRIAAADSTHAAAGTHEAPHTLSPFLLQTTDCTSAAEYRKHAQTLLDSCCSLLQTAVGTQETIHVGCCLANALAARAATVADSSTRRQHIIHTSCLAHKLANIRKFIIVVLCVASECRVNRCPVLDNNHRCRGGCDSAEANNNVPYQVLPCSGVETIVEAKAKVCASSVGVAVC